MRIAPALLATLLVTCVPAADVPPAAEPSDVFWYGPDGSVAWTAILPSGEGRDPASPLTAEPWFPLLPALPFDRLDGGNARTQDHAGRVLLLEFWATWCDPCADTLPWLQSLWEEKRESGFDAVAVNMQEPDDVVRQFFWALSLSLPLARYTDAMDEALDIDVLPTLLLVDRRGRIRSRVNGYKRGTEEKIAELVDDLLDDELSPAETIAEVLEGAGMLDVQWSRAVRGTTTGVAVVPGADGPTVLAATGREVYGIGARGETRFRKRVGPGVELLHVADLADGSVAVFGYRTLGKHVVRIPLDDAESTRLEMPSNVLDLAVEPGNGDSTPGLVLGTVEGLIRTGLDGETLGKGGDTRPVWQVASAGPEAFVVLGESGEVWWLDDDLAIVREQMRPGRPRVLVPSADRREVGVVAASVSAAVTGSFFGEGEQLALAGEDRLVVLESDTGQVRFRARWPGIASLGVGDLDGDGHAELLVGSGKRVTALRARPGQGTGPAPAKPIVNQPIAREESQHMPND